VESKVRLTDTLRSNLDTLTHFTMNQLSDRLIFGTGAVFRDADSNAVQLERC